MNNPTQDKSELIDEVLGKLAEDLINYDQRMTKAKAPNVRFVHKYTKEAKATLQKAFREVEIEGRIDEVNEMICNRHYGEGYADFFTEYANDRLVELTKIKEKG